MKTLFCILLSIGAAIATVSAGTPLIVDTVVTDTDAQGRDQILGHFHLLTEDGGQVVVPVGGNLYTVTAKRCDDGTVDLTRTMTHPNWSGKVSTLGPYPQNVALGKSCEISFGSVTYSTKVTRSR